MSAIHRQLKLRSKGFTAKLGSNVTPVRIHEFKDPKRKAPFETAKMAEAVHVNEQTMPDVQVQPTPALVKDNMTMNREMITKFIAVGAVLGLGYLVWRG